MSPSRTQVAASLIRSGASLAGTFFMHTPIFIRLLCFFPLRFLCVLCVSAVHSLTAEAQRSQRGTHFPSQRLKSKAALVPPKPKEFERASGTPALRAWL